jgi:hypothetical protein
LDFRNKTFGGNIMETTKIRIDVNQNAAIKLGRKVFGQIDIDIDPAELTPEQRETLAAAYKVDGHPYPQCDYNYEPHVGEATLETARYILDWHTAEKKRRAEIAKAEHEEKIKKALALPLSSLMMKSDRWENISSRWEFRDYEIRTVIADPRLADKIAESKAEIIRLNVELDEKEKAYNIQKAETDKKTEAEKAKATEEARQKSLRKKAQIAAWVDKNGTDNQKKRLSVNLLPDEEIIDLIRNEAFAPLADFPRYEKLTAADVDCSCGECDEKKAIYSVDDAATATAEQFDLMEKIKTLIPAAERTLREHGAYCDRCNDDDDADGDGQTYRYSLKVGLTVGEFYFSREYAA